MVKTDAIETISHAFSSGGLAIAETKGASPKTTTSNQGTLEDEGLSKARSLLPRETGHDIGAASPVPLSAEAVQIITRLRNMKVISFLNLSWKRVLSLQTGRG
jgi:hypothetical protein